ncbi:MAG TPA: glutamate--tRNA ligase, partial [Longimicrobiales bacterium]|nr:glutamate--tRNA ligase [Longimicrobiales bacterium]
YPCFCSSAELDAATVEGRDGREVRHYPGTCRGLDPAERARRLGRRMPHVVRFAVPDGVTDIDIEDEVFGDIAFSASDIDDFIIRRADGRATYNFAVVVDDVDMRISHVIRGVGHLSNTPKQALLFDALGAARPRFAHLPTVLGPEGRKLSKREGASSVAELRALGYPASAVLNYVSLLGWSHPEEREVLSAEELIASISLDRVGRSDAHMDPDKLLWVSARHVARETLPELTAHVAPFLDHGAVPVPDDRLPLVVDALRSRLSTYGEIREHLPILFPEETDELDAARRAAASAPGSADVLAAVAHALAEAAPWEDEALGRAVRDAGSRLGARGASLFHPVRQALIGTSRGPDLGKILAAIGRDEALRRIRASLDGNPV